MTIQLYFVLDENGEPVECDLMTYAQLKGDSQIALDQFGEVAVSTVFLGLNHARREGPPVLFETMIFGGPRDRYQRRYSTRKEAIEGHALAVLLAKGEREP